ncbi:hypothetical protein ACIF9R_35280 [Streptomyces sp. NPDC086080]|uniref:hypothetical protein n=1 Tax=Streptomyces sp. NPDC086080 TaxID=3365748 RepID=UPI0037D975FE
MRTRTGRLRRLLSRRYARTRETEQRLRLEHELTVSRQRLARWQQHADSYERQLGRAQRERAHLLAWLAALHPAGAVLTPLTGSGHEGAHRLCLEAGGWHLTWRLPPGDLALFTHVPSHPEHVTAHLAPDGDDAADQAARIRRHTWLLAFESALTSGRAGAVGGEPHRGVRPVSEPPR